VDLKHVLAKIISLLLIFSGLYQIFLSFNAIFFVYPQLSKFHGYQTLSVEGGLVEKAIIIYISMIVSGTYGLALLFKPAPQIKIAHIIIGILIFIGSLFFISQDPITSDPLQQFILNFLGQYQ
jgi:hypothetical protein